MSDIVLSVPVNAGGVDPLLASLEKINENLREINLSSKGSFELMSKSLDKTNKKLKETDKTFGDIFKKIKLSGLMKMGAGVIGAGAGLLGVSTGAMLFGSIRNAGGNLATAYQGKGLGLSSAEIKALQTASKVTTGKEDTLVKALTSLTTAMQTAEGQGAIATLGLNTKQLAAMKPEDALEAVFNAVKGRGTGIGSEYLQRAFSGVTGLSAQDYSVATKQGAAFESVYNEFLIKFKEVDFDALNRGAESMVKFESQLDIVSTKIGSSLADPLSNILDKLAPYLDEFADWLASLLDSITQEDVDNFISNLKKIFGIVADIAGSVFTGTTNGAGISQKVGEYYSGEKSGVSAAVMGTSLAGQTFFNMFTEEGRAKNAKFAEENMVRSWLNYSPEKIRALSPNAYKQMEEGGYLAAGQFTQKAEALRVNITVNDKTSGGITAGVQTQNTPGPTTSRTTARGGAR
jgi:uncharacterized protein YoxC